MKIDPHKINRLLRVTVWVVLNLAIQASLVVLGKMIPVSVLAFILGCYVLNPVNNWPKLERLSELCLILMGGPATFVVVVEGFLLLKGVEVIYISKAVGTWLQAAFGITRVGATAGTCGWSMCIILWLLLDPPPPRKRRKQEKHKSKRLRRVATLPKVVYTGINR